MPDFAAGLLPIVRSLTQHPEGQQRLWRNFLVRRNQTSTLGAGNAGVRLDERRMPRTGLAPRSEPVWNVGFSYVNCWCLETRAPAWREPGWRGSRWCDEPQE